MKIDVTKQLTNFNGDPAMGPDGTPILVRWALCTALESGDKEADGEIKFRRGALGQKIINSDSPDLDEEDRTELKKLVKEIHSPSVVFQVVGMLSDPVPSVALAPEETK